MPKSRKTKITLMVLLGVASIFGLAQVTSKGFKINSDGSLAVGQTQAGAIVTSFGWAINPDGSLAINSTKQPGAYVNSSQLTINPDGSVFATGGTGGGGGGTPASPPLSIQYNNAGAFGGVAPGTNQGSYILGRVNTTQGTAASPTEVQVGVNGRAITGAATSDTILYSDCTSMVIDHDQAATGAVNETLPTPITLNNPACGFIYWNHSAQTDTITPTTWTIQSNLTAPASSLSVPSGWSCSIKDDPNLPSNWLANCINTGGTGAVAAPFGAGTSGVYSVHAGTTAFTGAGSSATPIPGLAFTMPTGAGTYRYHCAGYYSTSATSNTSFYIDQAIGVTQQSTYGFLYNGTSLVLSPLLANNTVASGAHVLGSLSTNSVAFSPFFFDGLMVVPANSTTWIFRIDASVSAGILTISNNSSCDIWQSN